VAGGAALLPRKLFALSEKLAGSVPQPVTLSADNLLAVVPVSDPSSEAAINRLFPGLLHDGGFQQLRPLAFFVTNVSRKSVRAFSSHWTVTTASGEYETTIMHYFHRRTGRKMMHWGIKGNRTRFTGRVPIIKAGATRLLTPYFNWSATYYKDHGLPDWASLLRRRARPEINLSELKKPDSRVTMTVVAAITHDHIAVGPESQALARVFSVTRNAEHDEALSILQRFQSGDTAEQIAGLLRKHSSGLAFDIRPESDLYYRVRQRQAKVLLRRLHKARWDQFVRTLQRLSDQRRTVLRTVST
jgi:hypothetical protein